MTDDPGFHPDARQEFVAEIDHLNQMSPGRGDEFEDALYATLDMIDMWPLVGVVWPDAATLVPVRSLGIQRFPLRVVYVRDGDSFTIIAVAHQSREPGYWRHRVS